MTVPDRAVALGESDRRSAAPRIDRVQIIDDLARLVEADIEPDSAVGRAIERLRLAIPDLLVELTADRPKPSGWISGSPPQDRLGPALPDR